MRLTQAPAEKVFAAERSIAGVRFAIIALNVAVYYALLPPGTGLPWLAAVVSAVALPYGAMVLAFQPYRRFPVLLSAYFTTLSDVALITLWLAATGGAASPFYVLWYVSLAAIAFRFDAGETVVVTFVYAGCYVALVAAMGQLTAHAADMVVRTAYILFVGAIGAGIARHTATQTRATSSLQQLAEASSRITAQLEVDRVLASVLDAGRALVGADRAALYLLDPATGALRCELRHGLSASYVDARQRLFRALPGRGVLAGREPFARVDDARTDPRLSPLREAVAKEGFRSYVVVPLRLQGEGLGLMTLYRDEVRPFTDDEVSLASSLASHAAVAVANARLVGELRSALSLHTATLESTADGILVVDREGRMVSFNRRFVDIWGLAPEVAEARDDERAIASVLDRVKDPAAFAAKIQELYAHPEAVSRDVVELKDGRVLERDAQPQRLDGQVVGRVWSFRDVTAQRRAERERLEGLAKAQELQRLRDLDRFKTAFINMAAHELGTPLTPLKTNLFLLKAGKFGPLSAAQQRAVDLLSRNLERLHHLVLDMLESARIQAGKLGVDRHPVDLNRLVLETVETFESSARDQELTLESRLAPNLVADVDPKRMTQVLFNLLSNAIKFTPRGGHITIETRRSGDMAAVRVTDTGQGLLPGDVAKLFQPFSQVHDTMQATGHGTGLGLYISRAIVELHGGEIWADSPGPGQGATFGFTVPLHQGRAPAQGEDVAEAQPKKLTP